MLTSAATVAIAAKQFLFEVTLQRPWPRLDLFRPRAVQTLPVVLSVDQLWRILDHLEQPEQKDVQYQAGEEPIDQYIIPCHAVRKAIDLLIDRDALVKVVFSGTATPGHSPFAPSQFAFGDSDKYDKPNLEQAKKLLADAGVSNVSFTLKTGTAPVNVQVAQLIQNFLKPAGIDMQIEKLEFGTQLDQTDKGDFQASALGWSGRPDPDLNIYEFAFTGGANNDSQFSNPTVDAQLKIARSESDQAKRKAAYDQVMQVLKDEVPYVYLYHQNNVFAMSAQITGYTYVADGIIRAANMEKK